jgi:hypothetical protein
MNILSGSAYSHSVAELVEEDFGDMTEGVRAFSRD